MSSQWISNIIRLDKCNRCKRFSRIRVKNKNKHLLDYDFFFTQQTCYVKESKKPTPIVPILCPMKIICMLSKLVHG